MVNRRKPKFSQVGDGRRLGVGGAVFIIVMGVLFLLLAQSMVRHRFFSGSRFLHPQQQAN